MIRSAVEFLTVMKDGLRETSSRDHIDLTINMLERMHISGKLLLDEVKVHYDALSAPNLTNAQLVDHLSNIFRFQGVSDSDEIILFMKEHTAKETLAETRIKEQQEMCTILKERVDTILRDRIEIIKRDPTSALLPLEIVEVGGASGAMSRAGSPIPGPSSSSGLVPRGVSPFSCRGVSPSPSLPSRPPTPINTEQESKTKKANQPKTAGKRPRTKNPKSELTPEEQALKKAMKNAMRREKNAEAKKILDLFKAGHLPPARPVSPSAVSTTMTVIPSGPALPPPPPREGA